MTLAELNALADDAALVAMLRCCGSVQWARGMSWARPFTSREELQLTAREIWDKLRREDWLEAFAHHPRIGAKSGDGWASQEQQGVKSAEADVLEAIARGNLEYERKFGYLYLVCATGRAATELLEILRQRLRNEIPDELKIAADEQAKITRLRLDKLLDEGNSP